MSNVPEIRFKGYSDAWEQRSILEIAPLQRGFDLPKDDMKEGVYPVVMSNGINGFHSEYKAKAPGVVTGRSGTIGNLHFIETDYWPHNTSLWVTDFKGNYPKFIYHLYCKIDLSRFSTGSGVPTLNRNDVHAETVFVPSADEQMKISDILTVLDNALTMHKRKLERLKALKKGYLQQMFPQAGESVPRVRIDGYANPWTIRKLGDLFSERSERGAEGELISVTINSGVVRANTLERKDSSSEDKSNYKKVEIGDIAYNSMRMWQGASGYSNYSGILSPAYTVIMPNQGVCSQFFAYMFKLTEMIQTFQASSQGLTSDTWNLKYPLLKKISVPSPCFEEQDAIGKIFVKMDEQIAIYRTKLEKLKQLKQAYLQKMFV